MAEEKRELTIIFTPDSTAVRAEMESLRADANKGVRVPGGTFSGETRGAATPSTFRTSGGAGDPGGQYRSPVPTVSIIEQAQVERQMRANEARASSYGATRAMVMTSGSGVGGSASGRNGGSGVMNPRIDTNDAEISLRRLQGIFDTLKGQLETPMRIQVDTSQLESALRSGQRFSGGYAGGGGYSGTPREQVSFRRPPANSIVRRSSTNLSSVDVVDGEWSPGGTGAAAGGVSPQGVNIPNAAGQASPRAPGFGRRGGILPTSTIGGLLGLFAVGELASSAQAIREGDSAAKLAATQEQANLLRARGVEQGTSGLFGSAMAFIPNALDLSGSPQRMLREAQEADTLRQMREATRADQIGFASQAAFRAGFATAGPNFAALEQARVQTEGDISQRRSKMLGLKAQLDAGETKYRRGAFVGETEAGGAYQLEAYFDPTLKGDARTTVQSQYDVEQQGITNAQEGQAFRTQEYLRERRNAQWSSERNRQRSNEVARGASRRTIEYHDINRDFDERVDRAGTDVAQIDQINRERVIAGRALFSGYNRSDDLFVSRTNANSRADRAGQDSPVVGGIMAAWNRSVETRQDRMREAGAISPEFSQALTQQLLTNIRGVAAPAFRDFQAQQRQLSGSTRQLDALIGRNPLEAQLEGVRTQRDLDLQDASTLAPGLRQMREGSIRSNSAKQEQLIRQQVSDQRFERGQSLDSQIRQSQFRQQGARGRVDAVLDDIVSSTGSDVRGLKRENDFVNAEKRSDLGREQIKEARADYFRSFSFVDGGINQLVAGNGLGNIEKKFRDASKQIGNEEQSPTVSATASGSNDVAGIAGQILGYIREIATNGFTATAG